LGLLARPWKRTRRLVRPAQAGSGDFIVDIVNGSTATRSTMELASNVTPRLSVATLIDAFSQLKALRKQGWALRPFSAVMLPP
jgi:hypothetical protein